MNLSRKNESAEASVRMPENMPQEIIDNILTWLPTKPLVRLCCVSKRFCSLLTDPHFAKKHWTRTNDNGDDDSNSFILQAKCPSNFYYIPGGDFEKAVKLDTSHIAQPARIVGSANGIICLSHERSLNYVLDISFWNPATNEHKTLPNPQIERPGVDAGEIPIELGFGFVPSINDYRVVRLVPGFKLDDNGYAVYVEGEIYSLATNSWRRLGIFPYTISEESCRATLNGTVHWLGCCGAAFDKYQWIIAFNMADLTFRGVPLPKFQAYYIMFVNLRILRGCLSLFVRTDRLDIDVWIMKDYGVKDSWTRLYSVMLESDLPRPIDFVKNDELLLEERSLKMVTYNSESGKSRDVQIHDMEKPSRMDVVAYVETLVQL